MGCGGGGGAGFLFVLHVIEPLGVGHGGAWSEHADPGAVGGFSKEDGDAEAAGEDGEAGDVVDVLVGDEDGGELGGIFAGERHAAEEFAAGEAGIHQDAGAAAGYHGAVAFGAGGEHGHAHLINIRGLAVDWEVRVTVLVRWRARLRARIVVKACGRRGFR